MSAEKRTAERQDAWQEWEQRSDVLRSQVRKLPEDRQAELLAYVDQKISAAKFNLECSISAHYKHYLDSARRNLAEAEEHIRSASIDSCGNPTPKDRS